MPTITSNVWTARAILVLALTATGACATQQVSPVTADDPMARMGSMLVVERFLQAANADDYDAMADLFGTYDGPIEGPRTEVEVLMATLAEILSHDDYEIVSERRAIGRQHPTNRIGVDLTKGSRQIRDVPFLVVQSSDGGWLIEEFDTELILSG